MFNLKRNKNNNEPAQLTIKNIKAEPDMKTSNENNSTFSTSFRIIDTTTGAGHAGARMDGYNCRVYYVDRQLRIYFGGKISEELINEGFNALQLAFNDITGEYAFVFNKEGNGHPLRLRSSNQSSITVNSRKLTETLAKAYDANKGEIVELKLGRNQSKRPEVRFHSLELIKILKSKK